MGVFKIKEKKIYEKSKKGYGDCFRRIKGKAVLMSNQEFNQDLIKEGNCIL